MNLRDCSRKVNLSQLQRNTRSKKDKNSGRKRPRCGDYEPAPDSQAVCDSDVETVSL